ncbi:hypothetical protein BH10CYA1_BH10CYA1_61970 [soil metagenome]
MDERTDTKEHGKTQGEIARDAIRWYLENHKTSAEKEREDNLIRAIYRVGDRIIGVLVKSTEKICKLQLRGIIDTNILMMLLYRMLPDENSDDIMHKLYRMAVSRIARKVAVDDEYIGALMRDEVDQVTAAEELRKAS